jgi:hypothetical protein
MTQNIYDNDEFFEKYSRLSRSVEGLDGAPERPALRALLPELHGRKVLDLGCGLVLPVSTTERGSTCRGHRCLPEDVDACQSRYS